MQGVIYRQLLDAQLAHVTIEAHEPGTRISCDGKLLFTAPGTIEQIMLPGEHQITATRTGHSTLSKVLVAIAGKRVSYDVPPLERSVATRMVRHWAAWLPWSVLAGGAVLFGGGAASYVAARNNFESYDLGIAQRCRAGCGPQQLMSFSDLQRDKDRGEAQQVAAFSLLSIGAAALLAGGIGLIVNQPQLQIESAPRVVVTPQSAGAIVGLGWRY
jgi:hypothetical protein